MILVRLKRVGCLLCLSTVAMAGLAFYASPQQRLYRHIVDLIEHAYVDPNHNGRDWRAIAARYRWSGWPLQNEEGFYDSMTRMVQELGDDHSALLPPAQAHEIAARGRGQSQLVGVGVDCCRVEGKQPYLTVTRVLQNSPAHRAGIRPHDLVESIDGRPPLNSRTGGTGSSTTWVVRSPDGRRRRLQLQRRPFSHSMAVVSRLWSGPGTLRRGYLAVPNLVDETLPNQIRTTLAGWGRLDGLILDLRNNSGGSSDVALPLLGFFTGGLAGYKVNRIEREALTVQPTPVSNSQKVPLVVLINTNTISWAEIISGILQSEHRALLVGQHTRGNVELLGQYPLQGGGLLMIAEYRFELAHSQPDWEGRGVQPDLKVEAVWESFSQDRDPAIAQALQLLK